MTDELRVAGSGRLRLIFVAAVFLLPFALAAWMYYSGSTMVPDSGSNNGALLLPIVSLVDQLPQSRLHKVAPDQWLMLYSNTGVCAEDCAVALIRLRKSRLMLGKDAYRVRRVFLHGDAAPDTVEPGNEQDGLIRISDKDLSLLLRGKRPAELQGGGCYLIDPLGNLVMYFSPDLEPKAMVDDIKHLLRLSHIG